MENTVNKFEKYLAYERRSSKMTIRAYQTDLNQLMIFLLERYEVKAWNTAEHSMIRSWIVDLMQKGLTNRTINRKLSSAKSFFKFCLRQGLLEKDPVAEINILKTSSRLPSFAHEAQMLDLDQSDLFTADFSGVRDKALIFCIYGLGIRRAELIGLRISSYDKERSVIRVLGKGNKERDVPVVPALKKIIANYLSLYSSEFGYTLESPMFILDSGLLIYPKFVYNVVSKYLSTVSTLKKKGPHTLRHSFATHLSNQGADINALKSLLGHSSLAATQIYTHNSIEKLREVYKQAHPRSKDS
jgi:integrase/recombinase XerC